MSMFASQNTGTPIREIDAHRPSVALIDLDMQRFLRRRLLLRSDDIAEIDIALAQAAGLIPRLRATRSAERSQSRVDDASTGDGSERAGWLDL